MDLLTKLISASADAPSAACRWSRIGALPMQPFREWVAGDPGGSAIAPRRPNPVTATRHTYGSEPTSFCDLRLPPAAADGGSAQLLPVAVFVHGGAWKNSWTLDLADAMADDLAVRGWATWNMEYRRCGHIGDDYVGDTGGGYPNTLLDCAAALDALVDVAPTAHLDLKRVVIIGHSSGGHLALWLAQAHRSPLLEHHGLQCRVVPSAVVAQAPAADLAERWADKAMNGGNAREGGDPSERNAVEVLMGGTPETTAAEYLLASPASLLPLGVPVLLVNARTDLDVPVGSVLAYAARAKEAGDEVETLIFDGDDLAADVPGHFSIITPSLGDESGWPLQVRMIEDMMSRLAASADGAARL